MMDAESRAACLAEISAFVAEYAAKYPKAVESLTADQERLLTHFAFPAEHWGHLRTTNPIESTRAPVKLRQRVTATEAVQTAA
jgi:transposase-like protein